MTTRFFHKISLFGTFDNRPLKDWLLLMPRSRKNPQSSEIYFSSVKLFSVEMFAGASVVKMETVLETLRNL